MSTYVHHKKVVELGPNPKNSLEGLKKGENNPKLLFYDSRPQKIFLNLPSPKIHREPKWEKKALKGTKLKTNRWGFACKTNPKDCMTI